MSSKICTKCNENKPFSEFSKHKKMYDSLQYYCKCCMKKAKKNWDVKNPGKARECSRMWKIKNTERVLEVSRTWQANNQARVQENNKRWYKENKTKIRTNQRNFELCNLDYFNNYRKRQRQIDPVYKLKLNIRSRIYNAIARQGYSKTGRTADIIGLNYEDLFQHLKQTAITNYGKFYPNRFIKSNFYHIDHIIPISSAATKDEVIKLNHYTNLQLLYKSHNLSKSTKPNYSIPKLLT